jgi:hypothetical protein
MLSVTYAECHIRAFYAECRYSECHYAECHGALQVTQSTKESKFIKCFKGWSFLRQVTFQTLIH